MNSNHEATRRMIAAFEDAGIDYLLAGSYSSNYYGIVRATKDADFVAVLTGKFGDLLDSIAANVSGRSPTFL